MTIVRPWITTSRDALLEYLQQLGQTYRTDSSNHDCDFTRNRIRNELIPKLKCDYNPEVKAALLRLNRLAQQAQRALDAQVDDFLERSVQFSADGGATERVFISADAITQLSVFMRCEIFKRVWNIQRWPLQSMGFEQWDSLGRFVEGSADVSRTLTLPGTIRVCFEGKAVCLWKVDGGSSP